MARNIKNNKANHFTQKIFKDKHTLYGQTYVDAPFLINM